MYSLITKGSLIFRATAVGLVVAVTLFGFAFSNAKADVNPANCLANDFTTQLNKSTSVAYDQTNPNGATTIVYSVGAGNPQNVSNNGCNVDGVTITLTTPDGVVHTLQTGGSYPVGTAVTTLGTTVSYVANSANEVGGTLTASATATGSLHDTPSGTDPMTSGKTVSVTVINPSTTVTITPSVATTSAGTSVNLTVTEHNSGTDPITGNPSVTLTPPGTTLSTTSATFTGGDTGSDGILGAGETWTWVVPVTVSANTTYAAVGNGTDSLGHPVTSPSYPNEAASTTVHVLNSPTIATTLSASAVTIGSAVHDSAVLTGTTSSAGGTATYTAYTNNQCTTGAQSAGTKAVTAGAVPDSDPLTFNTAGSYYWQVVYHGDSNNAPATSTCGSEVVAVGKAAPSIATAPSAGGAVGTVLNDSATLSGGSSPTGSVTFNLYAPSDPTCSLTAAYTNTDATAPYATSPGFTSNTAGVWHWTAVYAGDANNSATTSPCVAETVTTTQLAPAISTTLSSSSVTIGAAVHDSSTLTGATADAGGAMIYTAYTDNECTTGAQNAGTKTVAAGVVPDSNALTFNTAGSYYWQAAYSGDAKNAAATSTCGSEIVAVGKGAPAISTSLSANSVLIGGAAHDSATLTGAAATAGGTATYTAYTDTACTLGAIDAGTKTVANGTVPDSNNITFSTPGAYYWQVAYSGDANNAAATSTCGSEVLTVGKIAPSISTTLSATSVSTSTPVHDSATLTGASSDAGGTAAYNVFTNSSCSAGAMSAGTKTVASGIVPDSDPLTFAIPGTYYWQVTYSGDANNAAATSTCSREVLTVAVPPPAAACEPDWKPVGIGYMDFGPIVNLNKDGRMFSSNNPCPLTLPLRFSPGSTTPTSTAPITTQRSLIPDIIPVSPLRLIPNLLRLR